MCAPILAVVGFSLILTYIFILYQPTRGPGIKQRVGWQSWEVINVPNVVTSGNPPSPSKPDDGKPDEGVDWWNVTTPEDKIDLSSLPLDVWSPLLPHDTGRTCYLFPFFGLSSTILPKLVSEITITTCFIDPEMAAHISHMCGPQSTNEEDAIKGRWVRVARNLNMEGTIFSGWLVCISLLSVIGI